MSAHTIDPRTDWWRSRRALFGIAVLALGTRLLYMALVIPHYAPDSDARQYEQLARSVARGGGLALEFPFAFMHASAFRPPLYPALLGGVWAVTGVSVGVGQIVNVALGCVAVVLAAVLAGRIGGGTAALATGVIASLYPPLIASDTTLLSEPLSLVLLLTVVLLLVDRRIEWAAVATGLLMLTRPSAQAFAVVLALWIVWRLGWRDALRYAALALLVVAPWVMRNWLVVGEPTLVTSNGFNLAAVYSAQATDAANFVDPVFSPRFEQQRYLHYSEGDWDKTLRDLALDNLKNHPSRVTRVIRDNAKAWFELEPHRNTSPERLDGRNIDFRNSTLFLFYLVTAGGLVGLALTYRSKISELLLICAAYFTVFSVLTVAPPRLRAPFDIAMCIGAGALISRVVAWRTAPDTASLIRPKDPTAVPDRSWALRTFGLVIALGLVGLVAGSFVARARVQDDAQSSVHRAIDRYGEAPAHLASYFPVHSDGPTPPPFAGRRVLHDLNQLEQALWNASIRLPSSERAATRRTAVDVSRARHEATLLSLYLAYESIAAAKQGVPFSVDTALRQYGHNRSQNPSLPQLREFVSGDAATVAARSVRRLQRELGDPEALPSKRVIPTRGPGTRTGTIDETIDVDDLTVRVTGITNDNREPGRAGAAARIDVFLRVENRSREEQAPLFGAVVCANSVKRGMPYADSTYAADFPFAPTKVREGVLILAVPKDCAAPTVRFTPTGWVGTDDDSAAEYAIPADAVAHLNDPKQHDNT